MQKSNFPLFAIIFLFLFSISRYSFAFDNGDFQYWNSETIKVKLAENWGLSINEEFRFGENAGTFYYTHTDAGVGYSPNKWLEVSFNYRQIFEEKGKHWVPEYHPHINGTLKADWNGFVLKDRNWIGYRWRKEAEDCWRYRNKLTLELPFKWTFLEIQPYAADEIFIDTNTKGISRNRVYLGFKMNFLKNLKGEIFYLRQAARGKANKWADYNVLGTALTFAF